MKSKVILFVVLLILAGQALANGKMEKYAIGFYNLENLFDTIHDEGKMDSAFLPKGSYKWDTERYQLKLHNLAKVLGQLGTDSIADGCAVIGVAEVENSRVLDDLCAQPPLKKKNMRYEHIEGPDVRGIDCALLYDPSVFNVRDTRLVPYVQVLEKDSNYFTRGFFIVSGTLAGEHLTVVVNHLPSRYSEEFYRKLGAKQLRVVVDSLLKDDPKLKLIVMGDMNDDPMDESMAIDLGAKRYPWEVKNREDLYNPFWNTLVEGHGTLEYMGRWNLFDQIILSKSIVDNSKRPKYKSLTLYGHNVFCRDYMLEPDGPFKGTPLRTIIGPKWLKGYSDHLPTVVYLMKNEE